MAHHQIEHRGQYDQPGERVKSTVPAVFPKLPDGTPANRLGLATWLVHPDHPLTSRVIVNRYWTLLFGQGLVATANGIFMLVTRRQSKVFVIVTMGLAAVLLILAFVGIRSAKEDEPPRVYRTY